MTERAVRELDRTGSVWVVPDEVPAIVPSSFSESRWIRWYRAASAGSDLLAGAAGSTLALLTRFGSDITTGYLLLGVLLPFGWVASVGLARGYESRYYGTGPEEFRAILRSGLGLTAAVAITSYALKSELARGYVLLAIPATVVLSMLLRWGLRRDLSRRRVGGRCMRRVLVVGRARQAATLIDHLQARPYDGFRVVATCVPHEDGDADIMAAVGRHRVDVVAIATDPDLAGHSLRRLSWALEQRGIDLIVSPGIVEVAGPRISVRPVAGLSLLHLERPSVSGGPHLLKSVFDRIAGLGLLLLTLPVLLVVAVAVRATSRGPVLFRQRRVGRAGAEFTMLKFRSMYADAEQRLGDLHALSDGNDLLFKMRSDPRVTPLGRRLRRFSLDELPQLINVVRGEMSLVGPRPPLPQEVARYAADDARRMLAKPGLTGLWQVSGRSDLSWEESVRLDLRYVDNWSMTLDLLILWKTIRAVLHGPGAY